MCSELSESAAWYDAVQEKTIQAVHACSRFRHSRAKVVPAQLQLSACRYLDGKNLRLLQDRALPFASCCNGNLLEQMLELMPRVAFAMRSQLVQCSTDYVMVLPAIAGALPT